MMNSFLQRKIDRINHKFAYFDKRVWYLVAIRVINALGFSVILPFISVYLYSEQGVPMTIVGSIFLGAAIVRAITQLMGGAFSDRLGRRKIMIIAALGRAASFFLLAASIYWHFPIYVMGIFILMSYGFGAMFMPAADALISDVVHPKDRVEAYSYQRIGLNFGWAIGPAIGGYLASVSYHLLFLIPAFFFLIVVFIVYLVIPDVISGASGSKFDLKAVKQLSKNHAFIAFGLLCFFIFSTITQTYSTLTVFSYEVVKITKIQLGYLYSLNGLVIILFQLPGIKWINRMTLTRALALGGTFAGMSYIVVAFSQNFLMLAIAIYFLTFGEIFFIPSGTTLTSNWAPDSQKGAYLGFYGLFQGLGRSFGPFYGGMLLDHFLHQPFILWGVIVIISFAASFGLSRIKRSISPEINQDAKLMASSHPQ